MNVFIDIIVDNEVPDYLQPYWENIKDEYYELSQNKSFNATTFLIRDIKYLENKLKLIQQCVDALRIIKNEKLIEILRFHGFDFSFSDETFLLDLDGVITQAQTDNIELQQLHEQWADMVKKNQGQKPTREYFGKWFDDISDDAGGRGRTLLPEETTVAEYCRRCNALIEKINRQQARKFFGK